MAGVPGDPLITDVTHDATHVSPMSRLITGVRPTGVGRAFATYNIPIEERAEWEAAAGIVSAHPVRR